VLDINQDPLGSSAVPVVKTSSHQIWAKKMEDGSLAVGLFNLDEEQRQQVTVRWQDLEIEGGQIVRDLWRQQDIGTFTGEFSAMVRPHGVVLVRITPADQRGSAKK